MKTMQQYTIDKNKQMCAAMWTSIYVGPDGKLDNCCVSKNDLGLAKDIDNVGNFYKSGKNLKIQQSMLENKTVSGCAACNNNDKWTHRKSFNTRYKDLEVSQGEFDFRYFDIRWSNACNLACMYCSPEFSSTWARDLKHYKNMPDDKETTNALLDYTLENITNLDYVYLAGGEPLMMKENEIFLAELAEKNPNCEVLVNSNISLIGKTKIYNSLLKMKNVSWLVSMENMGDQFEYVRYPANWQTTRDNLLQLKHHFGPEAVSFAMVYGNFNALSIWDTIDWIVENGFLVTNINIHFVDGGNQGRHDIHLLSREYLDRCLARIQSKIDVYRSIRTLQDQIKYLETISTDRYESKASNTQETLRFLEMLDRLRSLDSKSIFPDLHSELQKNLG